MLIGDERLQKVCRCGLSYIIKSPNADEIVGYVFVDRKSNHLWIDNIGISPEHRRKGLGEQLLNKVIGVADELNQPVQLQVRTDNISAINLYRRAGFDVSSENQSWTQMARKANQLIVENPLTAIGPADEPKQLVPLQVPTNNFSAISPYEHANADNPLNDIEELISFIQKQLNTIKKPAPTLDVLNNEICSYRKVMCENQNNQTAIIDSANKLKDTCKQALLKIKSEGLTKTPKLGDAMNNVFVAIVNGLNHLISCLAKLIKRDSYYTFFKLRDYTSPELRTALTSLDNTLNPPDTL